MKIKSLHYVVGYTEDGYLASNQGRIVIFSDKSILSNKKDHLSLLSALSSRYKLNKDDVISNAIRLYYSLENGKMIISPSRKIDDDLMNMNLLENMRLVNNAILEA